MLKFNSNACSLVTYRIRVKQRIEDAFRENTPIEIWHTATSVLKMWGSHGSAQLLIGTIEFDEIWTAKTSMLYVSCVKISRKSSEKRRCYKRMKPGALRGTPC